LAILLVGHDEGMTMVVRRYLDGWGRSLRERRRRRLAARLERLTFREYLTYRRARGWWR
jgi:hypothetical protein